MAEVDIRSSGGQASGRKAELSDAIFGQAVDREAVYQSVRAYQQNQSQGTRSTKTRAEVSGGGAKPYRQKGTGRARQGSNRAPHYEGGGIVHGPKPHRARQTLPKRMRRAAICSALSEKHAAGCVHVIETPAYEEPKTRRVVELLESLGLAGRRVLFVMDGESPVFYRSARNIPQVQVRVAPAFSARDVLWAQDVVLFEGAPAKLAEVWR